MSDAPRAVLAGLVGHGIQLSRSPAMHEAAGARAGLRYDYRLLDTAALAAPAPSLATIVDAAELAGYEGLNITIPYKKQVIALLDELSPQAEAIGAVNTVLFKHGRRIGTNTDVSGFATALSQGLPGAPLHQVLLVGAGGAGAAVAHALLQAGVGQLLVFDLLPASAGVLANRLVAAFGSERARALPSLTDETPPLDGLVNASPVGMAGYPGLPVPVTLLRPRTWVADVVYFPIDTALILTARERGCQTLTGAAMAVHQAMAAFELFAGVKPDLATMMAAFAKAGTAPR